MVTLRGTHLSKEDKEWLKTISKEQLFINYREQKRITDELREQVENLNIDDVNYCNLNTYVIKTEDTTGCFNFFTQAKDHKKALEQLLENSSDYRNIVKANRDLTISVKIIEKTD